MIETLLPLLDKYHISDFIRALASPYGDWSVQQWVSVAFVFTGVSMFILSVWDLIDELKERS